MTELRSKKIVVFLEKMYNAHEFWYPVYRLKEAGYEVVIAATEADKEYKSEEGVKAKSDKAFSDIQATDFDGVIVPGGFAPDYMRVDHACLAIVKELFDAGKLVAFICHAGWVPVSAGILKDKRATSVRTIKDDMINAGCEWEDAEVVVDDNLISSRKPCDLPAFMKAVLEFLDD